MDELIEEFVREKEYVEEQKPYWLFLDTREELEWSLFNYFPEAHYKKAIDQALAEEAETLSTSIFEESYQDQEVNDQ